MGGKKVKLNIELMKNLPNRWPSACFYLPCLGVICQSQSVNRDEHLCPFTRVLPSADLRGNSQQWEKLWDRKGSVCCSVRPFFSQESMLVRDIPYIQQSSWFPLLYTSHTWFVCMWCMTTTQETFDYSSFKVELGWLALGLWIRGWGSKTSQHAVCFF